LPNMIIPSIQHLHGWYMDVSRRLSSSMPASAHFRPRVLPEPRSVHSSGVDIRLDEDKTASVAPNASSHACWFERGGLWSGVISGRDAAQFELKTRDPPAGAIVVDSETWQGANIGPPFGWTNNRHGLAVPSMSRSCWSSSLASQLLTSQSQSEMER
jgi:hypothetical protein